MAVRSVIIVPGLLGSNLNRPSLRPPFVRPIWFAPSQLLVGLFDWLALPLPDQPGLPPPYAVIVPGTPLGFAYGPLQAYLTLRGFVTTVPRGDWRRPLAFDGELLLAQVRAQGLLGPVGLVCHSRGGLLARYVAARLVALGEIGKLEAVVTLGTPHAGSLNAVGFLAGIGQVLDRLHGLGVGFRRRRYPLLQFRRVRAVLRSWPSVYELLPDPDRSILPAAERAAVYDAGTYAGQRSVPYQPHLSAAAAAWRALPSLPESVRALYVGGEFVDTAYGFTSVPGPGRLPAFAYDTSGDGTVHTTSAFAPTGEGVLVPCAHDCLPLDGRVWPYIAAHLAGEAVPDLTIGGDVFRVG